MADMFQQGSDALSKLIQLQAGRYDIRLTWSGKGADDLIALCNAHAVKQRMSKHLWTGVVELMKLPEMATLPEPIQASIMSIVLKAQALVDLDTEDHAKKLADHPLNKLPKGVA